MMLPCAERSCSLWLACCLYSNKKKKKKKKEKKQKKKEDPSTFHPSLPFNPYTGSQRGGAYPR